MKKTILFNALLFLIFISCSSSDDTVERIDDSSLNSLQFKMVSFNIDIPVDINNDGTFSTDLIAEGNPCGFYPFKVNDEGVVTHPYTSGISLEIETDINGVKKQVFTCGIAGALGLSYQIDGDDLVLINPNNDEISFIGKISADKKLITLTFPKAGIFKQYILKQDGSSQEYLGGAVAVYELIE
ncbi:hypothetical protein [Tenacibaculum jejuense]|uniref:Probable lipoprotein n=1 Tax=Tenacibaculum jejuense TaxID=584609 RepID=A0A238UA73_9FLAO|nr:hypothetical protein [Tenacibaculum jejuense]SNR16002.1 Probable lipoprotein precursor [Tenacibaculum jejuense]